MNKNKKRVIRQTDSLHVYETVFRSLLTFLRSTDETSRRAISFAVCLSRGISCDELSFHWNYCSRNFLHNRYGRKSINENKNASRVGQTFFFLWKLCSIFINLFVSMNEISHSCAISLKIRISRLYVARATFRRYFAYLFIRSLAISRLTTWIKVNS